jgi:hypothetical protein
MSDPNSSPTPPSHPRTLDLAAAKRQLDAFVAIVKHAVSAARQHARPVENNSVVVDRTGKSYPSINAALASISDASQQKQYVLLIGAGAYTEVLTCKSWVFLSGAGRDQTLITAMTEPNAGVPATITAAPHSSVQDCTVRASTTGPFDPSVTAILCQGAFDFDVENCALIAVASNQKPVTGITLDSGDDPSGLHVNIAYTTVTATGGGKPIAISADHGAFGHGMQSSFIAEKGSVTGVGGFAANGATLLVEDCIVQGTAYSLFKDEGTSSITANQCKLTGPVGPGVVVNP